MNHLRDMPEHDVWVEANYRRLVGVAVARGGTEDAVTDAVYRALRSPRFPANDESRWWSWYCSAIRSSVDHALVASFRERVKTAPEGAAAILSESQYKRTRRRTRQVHAHTIRPKYPKPRWPRLQYVKVAHVGACACGAPMWWVVERMPDRYLLSSLQCWNGHHTYGGVNAIS